MSAPNTLEQLVSLRPLGGDCFEALLPANPPPRLFGGQLVAQALAATLATVRDDRPAHSLHAHFLRPCDGQTAIQYHVETLRESRTFSTRRVAALQNGKTALVATVSCQASEPGLNFAPAMPQVPAPEGLRTEQQVRIDELAAGRDTKWVRSPLFPHLHYDLRPVHPRKFARPEKQSPKQAFWFRLDESPPATAKAGQAMLAYLTDIMLLSTTLLPHGVFWTTTPMQEASLDHAVWFHAPPRFDEWMLWDLSTEWTGSARGLARGRIFANDGTLLASVAQEGLIRLEIPEGESGGTVTRDEIVDR
nr:acyl-CoA thioesterase domain-containing protein [Novosphingobium hassiacum]